MSYQERTILEEKLEKLLEVLDSDEGIRIDNEENYIFINKTSRRFCIDISTNGKDEFVYKDDPREVMRFLKKIIRPSSKIFAY